MFIFSQYLGSFVFFVFSETDSEGSEVEETAYGGSEGHTVNVSSYHSSYVCVVLCLSRAKCCLLSV